MKKSWDFLFQSCSEKSNDAKEQVYRQEFAEEKTFHHFRDEIATIVTMEVPEELILNCDQTFQAYDFFLDYTHC